MVDTMQAEAATRHPPLLARAGDARCHPAAVAARFSLRLPEVGIAPAAAALGVELAVPINRAMDAEGRAAIRLGPDEWLLLMSEAEANGRSAALDAALTDGRFSLVDIGQRQAGIVLEGDAVADMLNAGCPLDLGLAAFPIGMATRTVFHKAEIVLWRQGKARFHLEVWRSFAPYVWDLLGVVGREYPE